MQAATTLKKPYPEALGLSYPIAEAPILGTVTAVAPGVFWLRMPLPFVLNHINLWLLEDVDGWTIVDCGFATDEARGCWDQIFAQHLGGKPVKRLIVTHFHPDHIGLCHWLCEKHQLMPWMTKAEYLQAHAVRKRVAGTEAEPLRAMMLCHGLDEERMRWIDLRDNLYDNGVPNLPRAHRRIRDGENITIGANAWQVIVGHGHAPEHASLYSEALGVFIAGDMLLPRISTNVSVWPAEPAADPVGDFLASLARYATLDAGTLVLPSHGLPFHGMHARIDALREHHRVRLERVTQACVTPQSAAEILPVLFDRKFDDHHLLFAMGEGIAHLNYLMHRGILRRSVDGDGHYRFQRTETA
ncbi:MAG TPA: MBL fold metallo-hydrolase [Burkholderiales bacterium]|nr:MBL fold metallo-hydrolase [Burkholderiales bacterium]